MAPCFTWERGNIFNLQFINKNWRTRTAQSAQGLCYRLEDGIRFPVGVENVLHSTQVVSATLQCSIAHFQSLKGAGREADFLLASAKRNKMCGNLAYLPNAVALLSKRDFHKNCQ